VGWRPDLQEEIQDAEKPEARWHGCWDFQKAHLEVLPSETGRARIGQYLHWAKVRPTAQCWWRQGPIQTRERLFDVCPE